MDKNSTRYTGLGIAVSVIFCGLSMGWLVQDTANHSYMAILWAVLLVLWCNNLSGYIKAHQKLRAAKVNR